MYTLNKFITEVIDQVSLGIENVRKECPVALPGSIDFEILTRPRDDSEVQNSPPDIVRFSVPIVQRKIYGKLIDPVIKDDDHADNSN